MRGNRNDFGGKVCCSPSRPLSGILSRGVHTCVNAQFTKHSVQLRSLPCQRVSSYVFQIYTGASSLHVFLDLSLELTPSTSPPFFSSSKSKFPGKRMEERRMERATRANPYPRMRSSTKFPETFTKEWFPRRTRKLYRPPFYDLPPSLLNRYPILNRD